MQSVINIRDHNCCHCIWIIIDHPNVDKNRHDSTVTIHFHQYDLKNNNFTIEDSSNPSLPPSFDLSITVQDIPPSFAVMSLLDNQHSQSQQWPNHSAPAAGEMADILLWLLKSGSFTHCLSPNCSELWLDNERVLGDLLCQSGGTRHWQLCSVCVCVRVCVSAWHWRC